jgi:hypothetical protein
MIAGLIEDLRYAVRQLRKKPGFALVAIITLKLGAEPASGPGMVLGEATVLLLGGIAIGITAALLSASVMEKMLDGARPRDPLVMAASVQRLPSPDLPPCAFRRGAQPKSTPWWRCVTNNLEILET